MLWILFIQVLKNMLKPYNQVDSGKYVHITCNDILHTFIAHYQYCITEGYGEELCTFGNYSIYVATQCNDKSIT